MATPDSDQEFQDAMNALGTLISGKARGDGKTWKDAFDYMQVYLERLDLDKRLSDLNVVHVAGTKGKGSTCAMVDSILRSCGYKTGLFTSPHLWDVRERIQLNGQPVSREVFLREFWKCYKRLEDQADEMVGKAAYFRFLTLLGLQTFLAEEVDVAILEVGLGGRLDATNVIRAPFACGITPLGYDHMAVLGHTLPEIAGEKAGILKPGCPAFTVPQPADAMAVIEAKAKSVGAPLTVVPSLEEYEGGAVLELGLAGQHQRSNAALAISLAAAWEAQRARQLGTSGAADAAAQAEAAERRAALVAGRQLPAEYREGLRACHWPGRAQLVEVPNEDVGDLSNGAVGAAKSPSRLSFYLDGAHTEESMATCATWFADAVGTPGQGPAAGSNGAAVETQRVLLFNCLQEREPQRLLRPLTEVLRERGVPMHQALFVPADSSYSSLGPRSGALDLSWQQSIQRAWEEAVRHFPSLAAFGAHGAQRSVVAPSISSALDWLRTCVRERPNVRVQVLVTGSLYLVGDVLKHLSKYL
ncbi:putative folylpolyglutamate synthetase [Coccomyxa subellipsoidea C-169]|uniref:Folylpolyglutamate synthase n=1 Tax=Coccomyxa subellipsoidea (strain C-169) TaxID=574566 RepID=I0YR68_COCSC|nr:putative folylpolyglutamate synthetase [Coccomyxa subellipsoidea C-169]EIE20887.1 putative folylpolyglutamate synthetase [Coccomyxa subellipsoidea C-169]|eukprot:XP_005645431.1 putative folylpolyglutamate synthetase [Coccomyxa subellipsoidea C-169]